MDVLDQLVYMDKAQEARVLEEGLEWCIYNRLAVLRIEYLDNANLIARPYRIVVYEPRTKQVVKIKVPKQEWLLEKVQRHLEGNKKG